METKSIKEQTQEKMLGELGAIYEEAGNYSTGSPEHRKCMNAAKDITDQYVALFGEAPQIDKRPWYIRAVKQIFDAVCSPQVICAGIAGTTILRQAMYIGGREDAGLYSSSPVLKNLTIKPPLKF